MKPLREAHMSMSAFGLAAAICLASPASAQTVLIDQGTFRLSLGGREVGRDSFNIGRTGSGDEARILAEGWVDVDRRQISSKLETTGAYALTSYQARVTGADSAQVQAVVRGRRMELTVRSPAGEQTREARAPAGAVLLDENIAHQYYFLGALAREGATIPVITPRRGDPVSVAVQSIAPGSVTIGGQRIDATQLQLSASGVEQRLWTDAQGRVLRVEIPSTGYVAERLRPPA
jgi:hypothetical protein